MELYHRIEELCKKRSKTVTDLCRECDISRGSLSDFKKGRVKTLSATTLEKISNYFGVSVDYLLGKESAAQDENRLKVALFGGSEIVTDEMWREVKRYAQFVLEREHENL